MEVRTFEQKITDTVNEKLNDGTVEKVIEQSIEKAVQKAMENLFSWNGDGIKLIEGKLKEIMIPAIERHDFNKHIVKFDVVLTEIIDKTSLVENEKILEKFKTLMIEPGIKEINLSDIFEKYCEHVAANVDTYDLKPCCDDGEPYYEYVTAEMEVEHEDKGWFRSSYDNCIVKFICKKDEKLNCRIKLFKDVDKDTWSFIGYRDSVDFYSLRDVSDFEVFLMTLSRAWVKIIMDEENDSEEVELDEKPEWSLS